MSEIICPGCGHDIGADCHTKLDTLERKCHCTYWARDIAEKLIGDLRVESDALRKQLEELEFYKLDAKASRSALDKLLLEYYSLRKQLEIAVKVIDRWRIFGDGQVSIDGIEMSHEMELALAEIEKIEQR